MLRVSSTRMTESLQAMEKMEKRIQCFKTDSALEAANTIKTLIEREEN